MRIFFLRPERAGGKEFMVCSEGTAGRRAEGPLCFSFSVTDSVPSDRRTLYFLYLFYMRISVYKLLSVISSIVLYLRHRDGRRIRALNTREKLQRKKGGRKNSKNRKPPGAKKHPGGSRDNLRAVCSNLLRHAANRVLEDLVMKRRLMFDESSAVIPVAVRMDIRTAGILAG